jgi:hypothetical protein
MKSTVAIFAILGVFSTSAITHAQEAPKISLALKDAPVREGLTLLFQQAGIKNFIIDNQVAGFVTVSLADQSFEQAMKYLMRASSMPLTYTKEGDTIIVKPRAIKPVSTPEPEPIDVSPEPPSRWERISLIHISPESLNPFFGVRQFHYFPQQGVGVGQLGNGINLGNNGNNAPSPNGNNAPNPNNNSGPGQSPGGNNNNRPGNGSRGR